MWAVPTLRSRFSSSTMQEVIRDVMIVPTWYKCPWGLKMVICLSKFPCDILELEKDQKEANKMTNYESSWTLQIQINSLW